MNPFRPAAALLLLAGLSCPGEDAAAPPVQVAPPQPVPASWQANGYVWVPGHWDWTGKEYSWRAGSWQPSVVPAQTPLAWIEGQWNQDPTGAWNWIPGHYEQIAAGGQTQAVVANQTLPPSTVVVQEAPTTTVIVEEPGVAYYGGPAVVIGSPFYFGPYWGRDGCYHQGYGGYGGYGGGYGGGYYRGGAGGTFYAPGVSGSVHASGRVGGSPPLPPPIRR